MDEQRRVASQLSSKAGDDGGQPVVVRYADDRCTVRQREQPNRSRHGWPNAEPGVGLTRTRQDRPPRRRFRLLGFNVRATRKAADQTVEAALRRHRERLAAEMKACEATPRVIQMDRSSGMVDLLEARITAWSRGCKSLSKDNDPRFLKLCVATRREPEALESTCGRYAQMILSRVAQC